MLINTGDTLPIYNRYQKAKSQQFLWLSIMLAAYDWVLPNRNLYYAQYTPAQRLNTQNVYDTTAISAMTDFVSMIQSSLTPPGQKWVNIRVKDYINGLSQEERDLVQQELENVGDTFFQYINDSNFSDGTNQSYFDLGFGTMALLVNEIDDDNQPFVVESVPPFFLYPEDGPYGVVQTVFRDLIQIKIADISQMWPGAELDNVHEIAVKNDPTAATNVTDSVVYDKETKKYRRLVFDTLNMWIYFDEEMESSPWIFARWSKLQTEVFGRGPVLDALPTIKSLNQLAKDQLMSSAFSSQPAYFGANDGVFNPYTAQIKPGSVIPVNSLLGNPPITLIPRNSGAVHDQQVGIQDLRVQVNDMLFANPLGPVDAPNKTATELTLRQQRLLQKIGPAFGRLYVELITPLVKRILYILSKRGLIPKVEIDGKKIYLEFVSPLAQSQQLSAVLGLQQMGQILVPLVGPQLAVQFFNLTAIPQGMGEALNVPANWVKTQTELEAIVAEVTKGLQQAQQNVSGIAPEVGGQPRVGGPQISQSASQALLASGGF